MKYSNIKNTAEKILMPEDMKKRITANCKSEISQTRKETIMKNNMFKRPAAVFAAMAICLSLSVTALAATCALKGFFQDVKRLDGAVIGTTYEQATDEIALKVNVDGDTLIAVASFTDKAPFTAEELGIGEITLTDILKELEKPARDPRDDMPKPILRSDVLDMKDLKPGMILKGTVRNVIDFGVFVDIGVHQDGLVHISQITERFIKHPLEAVSVGDVVDVQVLTVDLQKKRIGLTMRIQKN